MRKSIIIYFVAFAFAMLLAISNSAIAQITGQNPVTFGTTTTYTFDNGNIYSFNNWQITYGTINSTSSSGTTYSCNVTWGSSCVTGTLTFRSKTLVISSLNVTIDPSLPTPSTSFTITEHCQYSTITRSGGPPSGVTWYWQTSSTGTDTSYPDTDYNVYSAGYYYLRPYACGQWGSSQQTGLVHGIINPGAPSGTNGSRCGPGTVVIGASPGSQGDDIRWYDASSGGNLLGTGTSFTTPSISFVTNYYAATLHTEANCESSSRTVVQAYVYPVPDASASDQTICSGQTTSVNITNPNDLPGTYFSWTASSSGVSGASNGSGYSIVQTLSTTTESTGTVTYSITPFTSNCSGTPINVVVTVYALGVPTGTFTTTQYCRYSTITRNDSPPTGITWYWQTTSSGTSMSYSGASYDITAAGTYYIRAYGCGAWSVHSLSTGSIAAPIDPAAPTGTNGSRCGPGTVDISATPGSQADNIRWYDASSGGTLLGTGTNFTTQSINSLSYYYAASLNTATNCESISRTLVTASVNPVPDAAASGQSICSGLSTSINITNPNSVPGTTFSWTANPSNVTGSSSGTGSSIAQTLSASEVSEGNVTYSVVPSTTSCHGDTVDVIVTVTSIPLISLTGPNPMIMGTPTTVSTSLAFYSYQWNKDAVDISGATLQQYQIESPANYGVSVKSSASSAACASADTTLAAAIVSQGANVNAVITTTIFKEGLTGTSSLYTLAPDEYSQTTSLSDGLGRVFQTVAQGAGPNREDLVSHVAYGKNGLVDTTFLPFATAGADGRLKLHAIRPSSGSYHSSDQYLFYHQDDTSKLAYDDYPFAKAVFASTPDAHAKEQGAPGQDWQPGGGHTIRRAQSVNTSSYPVRLWKSDGTTSGNYPSKTVFVAITTDENGNKVRTYTNKLGQTVLKQVQLDETINGTMVNWLDTYYIYDDFGNLTYQVPPKAMNVLGTGSSVDANNSSVAELIYKYTYDTLGRLVEKKEPGAVAKYMIYDRYDRLVLTQDGNLRSLGKWAFVKYDRYGRTVYTGIYSNSRSRSSVQKWASLAYSASSSTYPESTFAEYKDPGPDSLGYSNVSFPSHVDSVFKLSVSYYDSYDFYDNQSPQFVYNAAHIDGLPDSASSNVRGLPTGSIVRILDSLGNITTNWLKKAAFYDELDRTIQTQSNNHLNLAAVDTSSVLYNNVRRVAKTKTTHTAQGVTTDITQRSEYDYAGRVTKAFHQINESTEYLVAQYEYNALGQLVDKKLHQPDSLSEFLQSVDYRYNIRGWLTSINNAQLADDSDATNDDSNDFFGMELAYNTSAGMSNTAYYNGNISAMRWKTWGDSIGTKGQRSYKYSYDKSDKLEEATFQVLGDTTWNKELNTLNESMAYDHGGNILKLKRNKNSRGLNVGTKVTVTNSAVTMDSLSYSYTSNTNRLDKVEDSGPSAGFVNGSVGGSNEYTYTDDGSANKDDNKGITSIAYNILGKVQLITFNDGRKVEYIYDAVGTKLTVTHYDTASQRTVTNYAGGFIYQGTTPSLSQFSSPEGRVANNGSEFEYQYALTDHQGNTRVLFTSVDPTAAEYLATFEEPLYYGFNMDTTKMKPFTAANHTPGGHKVYKMNQDNPVGLSKSLAVYPGDSVKVDVWAYYEAVSGYGTNSVALVSAIAAAFGGVNGGGGESGSIYNGVNSAFNAFFTGGNPGDEEPAAYLNYILFDLEYNVLDAGWTRVPTSANYSKQKLDLPAKYIKEAGYYFTYISYEDESDNIVYFDDYKVRHVKSRLIQGNEYYPYGMQTERSWTREAATENYFLANSGTELNTTTQMYDLFYRNYDPVLGRFAQVDPMTDVFSPTSPYNFAGNNPTNYVDADGLYPKPILTYDPNLGLYGGYRFTKSAAHLLSLVSGVHPVYIQQAVIQERAIGQYRPFYSVYKGGGAMTIGWHGTGASITYTENWFADDRSDYEGHGYGQDIFKWLEISSHEVGHLPQIDEEGGIFGYMAEFVKQYAQSGSHDGAPYENEAEEGAIEFRNFHQFVNETHGNGALENMFSAKGTQEGKIKTINQWWGEYQQAQTDLMSAGLQKLNNNFDELEEGTYKWNGSAWTKVD